MKTRMHHMALAAMFALAAGSAGAAVTVSYVQPEKFTDIAITSWERENALKDIGEHFNRLGRGLPPGQDLRIEVLDIDLAGRMIPSRRRSSDVRVYNTRGTDWPRMQLRYVLEQDGRVIKRGEARLSDMNYLNHSRYFDNVTLRYDKQMIDDWYRKTIGPLPRNVRR